MMITSLLSCYYRFLLGHSAHAHPGSDLCNKMQPTSLTIIRKTFTFSRRIGMSVRHIQHHLHANYVAIFCDGMCTCADNISNVVLIPNYGNQHITPYTKLYSRSTECVIIPTAHSITSRHRSQLWTTNRFSSIFTKNIISYICYSTLATIHDRMYILSQVIVMF